MKSLSQEEIRRMFNGGTGGSGGGGGLNPSALAGFASQSWVEGGYVSKTFFNSLFTIHTKTTTTVTDANGDPVGTPTVVTGTIEPNETVGTTSTTDESTGYTTTVTKEITSIEAKHGLWTDFFLSALGQNSSGGGGGGGSLNEPLFGINNAGLSNHPSSSGQTIVWNGTAWVYGSIGSSTIAWSNITNKPTTLGEYGITDAYISSGAITLGSNSITPWTGTNHPTTLSDYGITDAYTKSEVYNKTEADDRFLTIAFFSRLFQARNGSTNVNPNDTTSTIDNIKALFGFWTDQYLSALGQNSSGGGGGGSLNEPLLSINTSGLSAPGSSQDGMTIVWDNATQKWKYGAVGSSYTLPLAANGTRGGIQIGFTTNDSNRNYAVLLSGEKAYVNVPWTDTDTWRPVQDNLTSTSTSDCLSAKQGNVLKGYFDTLNGYFTDGSAKTAMKLTTARTIWGQNFDGSANVTGSLNSVESITMSGWIHGTQCIEMNDDDSSNLKKYGGFIDFHFRDASGNKMSYDDDYSARLIEGDNGELDGVIRCCTKNPDTKYSFFAEIGLRIGDARLVWDSYNNALKVEKYDGTVANFYATGGVSALGMQAGVSVLDAMTFNYVTINNNLELGSASRITHAVINDDRTLYIGNSDNSGWVGLADMCSQAGSDKWYIYAATGEASFMTSVRSARFYLDSSRYLYLDGSNNLMFYNGTTAKQVAFIN